MSWLDELEGGQGLDQLASARAGIGQVAAPPVPTRPEPVAAPVTPGAVPAGGQASGELVDWNGHKIDRSILSQAEDLQKNYPGLRLTSGHRSPEHNASVGGAKKSDHLTGRALDFTGSAKDMYAAVSHAQQNGAKQAMVHNVGSGVHAHIAY